MNFIEATKSYEAWLGSRMTLVRADLAYKHEQMAADIFRFLRATYYRWAQVFPTVCPELYDSPEVLSVGDLHAENFGTWRDADGRLVWGINDFDEAFPLPYTNDLVRLAASVRLAIDTQALRLDASTAYQAIEDGYNEWLFSKGRPFVLAEKAGWLRQLAEDHLRDPVAFWFKLKGLPKFKKDAPPKGRALLESSLPESGIDVELKSRRAGMGSLGRMRIVALGKWRGGMIAREAKVLTVSACAWALELKQFKKILNAEIRERAVRCPDPVMRTREDWIVRRLSPDCTKIDLAQMPRPEEARFVHAMGRETANIHLGSAKGIDKVRRDFIERRTHSPHWLALAADAMVEQTRKDWKAWRIQ